VAVSEWRPDGMEILLILVFAACIILALYPAAMSGLLEWMFG